MTFATMPSSTRRRIVSLALVAAAALGAAAGAAEVRPYQAHAPGDPRTDLEPLERYVSGNHEIETDRLFELNWEAGVGKQLAGEYQSAVDYLSLASQHAPLHPIAAFTYAMALMAAGRDALAAENLRGAIGLYPGWRDLSIEPAEFFGSPRDYFETHERLLRAYDLAGAHPDPNVLGLLGVLYYYEGDMQKARVALEQLRADSPGDRIANHFLTGISARGAPVTRAGDLGPAPAGTTRRQLPEDPFEAGASLLYIGRYGQAMERFAEVILRDPGHPYAFFELAQALFGLGRFSQAATAVHQGLDRNPAILSSGLRRREFYDDPARLDAELAALQEAVQKAPRDTDLIFLLGFELFLDDQRDRAVMAMQLVDRMQPGTPHASTLLQAILSRGADRAPGQPLPPPAVEPPTKDDDDGSGKGDGREHGVVPVPEPSHPPLDVRDDAVARFLAGDYQGTHLLDLQRVLAGEAPRGSALPGLREDVAFILAAIEVGKMLHAVTACDALLRGAWSATGDRGEAAGEELRLDLLDYYAEPADLSRVLRIAEAYQRDPTSPDPGASTLLGFLLHYSGAPDRAQAVFASVHAKHPDDPHAPAFLAMER